MGRLTGKIALVTAAGQGIGRATAEAFHREGARVIATDRDPQLLSETPFEVRKLDVLDARAIDDLARTLGPIDILSNNAGMVHSGTILECDETAWTMSWKLNVTAMYRMVRAFLPGMLDLGGGAIVNVASVASSIKGVPGRFAYGATKAAVIGLTKSIAADFVTRGVRCNAICPGTIDTPSLQQRLAMSGDYEAAKQAFTARQPMGRLGTAAEIAALAVYLASDEAAFTTGQTHIIDGGWIN